MSTIIFTSSKQQTGKQNHSFIVLYYYIETHKIYSMSSAMKDNVFTNNWLLHNFFFQILILSERCLTIYYRADINIIGYYSLLTILRMNFKVHKFPCIFK